MSDREKGQFLGHTSCDKCGSSDAAAVYLKDDGTKDAFCWSCTSFIPSNNLEGKTIDANPDGKPRKPRKPITQKQADYVSKISGFRANKYRSISDNVLKFTGIRTELDDEGNVVCRFYPAYKEDKDGNATLVGYKRRYHPKSFKEGPVGVADSSCMLLGQSLHRKGSSRRLLVAGGECDFAAGVQMLREYQRSKGFADTEPFAVVSPLVGESGSIRQMKNNMKYLDSFDQIIIGYDNDSAGKKAAKELAMILPEGKVFIAEWPEKDINACLIKGKSRQFIDSYFNAKPFSQSVIKSSALLLNDAIERARTPRIPLPPFLDGVSEMLCGGIPLGYMVNILSASGCVDADTEFMTKSGWKRIADYEEGDDVLQFEDDTKSSFVQPSRYIKLPAKTLTRYSDAHLDMCLSDEHIVVYKGNVDSDYISRLSWKEVKLLHETVGFEGYIPLGLDGTYTSLDKNSLIEEYDTQDGFKYCFTVPSGMLVLRRNGKIFCTGNSGKSTLINECVYYWALECPYMTGIVSLEATAGEYFTNLLSRHLGKKIELIPTPEEKVTFLESDYVRGKAQELCVDGNGNDRFKLLDDRGDITSIKKNIEDLITIHNCKVIVIDVLQDILDEINTEEEARFLRWLKMLMAKHEVTIININHARKNSSDKKANSRGGELTEESMQGSSSIYKSGGINIIMTRDKLAECPIARNTIDIVVSKARGTGITGSAGSIYYDNKSHTLIKMTPELLERLTNNQGAIDIDDTFSHNIPSEFVEQDIYGGEETGELDTPFAMD